MSYFSAPYALIAEVSSVRPLPLRHPFHPAGPLLDARLTILMSEHSMVARLLSPTTQSPLASRRVLVKDSTMPV